MGSLIEPPFCLILPDCPLSLTLLQLDLSNNRLCGVWLEHGHFGKQMGTYTAEGIIALADALKINGQLTNLW